MGLSKISMWYAHQNKNIILNQTKNKPFDGQQQAPDEADLIVILSLPFRYVFPFSLVLPSRSASSCCHSSFWAAICFGIFFPFFFGFFSRFLGLDGFHCVLQASSLICIVLLHVGPQKVVVSQAMLHAKTQHLPPKQNDNTYCHQQGYRQKHLYISVSLYIYINLNLFMCVYIYIYREI